jgi:hypothetical protein
MKLGLRTGPVFDGRIQHHARSALFLAWRRNLNNQSAQLVNIGPVPFSPPEPLGMAPSEAIGSVKGNAAWDAALFGVRKSERELRPFLLAMMGRPTDS